MLYWTLRATGSASLMGLLLAASTLPGLLLNPIGGAFADRWPRLRVVLISDLLSGVAMAVLALVMLRTEAPGLIIPLLFAVSVLLGVGRAFLGPALLAAVPDVVAVDQLQAANGANQFALQGAMLLGQGVGGVLYTLFGAPLLFLGDAASFLISAACTGFIRRSDLPARRAAAPEVEAGTALRRFWLEILEGLRFVRRTAGFLPLLLANASFNFFLMPVTVLLPIYIEKYLHAGARWYGFTLAAVGGGSLVGFVLSGLLHLAGRARARTVVVMMLLAPTTFIAIGFSTVRPAAVVIGFLLGVMLAINNVHVISVIQGRTPPELRGRVLGLLSIIVSGLSPIGMAVGGIVGDLTGKNIPLVYTLCGTFACVLELVFLRRRSVYDLLAAESTLQPDTAPPP
jgi:MFS family permease